MTTTEIQFSNARTRAKEDAEGSDGRLHVSSRTDARSYYNSRDAGQTYSLVWNFDAAANGEFAVYLQNTSTDGKHLVVEEIGVNAEKATRFKLHYATGTASAGNALTPVNLNRGSSNAAAATAREGGAEANGLTIGGTDGLIDHAYVIADGHEELRLKDRLRLGQNDAITIEVDERSAEGDVSGVIFFYFE